MEILRSRGPRRATATALPTGLLTVLLLVLPAAPPASAALATGRAQVTAGRTAAARSLGPVVLPVPLPPVVLTPFRPPADRWGAGHRGVDLAAAPGTPIRAAAAGVIAFAGEVAGRPVISVAHTTALRTTYEPVLPTVPVGTAVTAGQLIGLLQDGHPSCSPVTCLHWGARVGADRYLDPLSLLTGIRVRLKPWD